MNLITKFHKAIIEIGIPVLEHPIFYHAPIGIRFEIGGEEDVYIKRGIMRKLQPNPVYVSKAVDRALTIFNALPKKDLILRIDVYDKKEITKVLKTLQLKTPHETVINKYVEDVEEMTHYELYWSLDDINWSEETLIHEIILADIGGLNSLASSVYLLHPNEKILYHLYDDRGLDVVAKDYEKLFSLYETFNDWILDYDRESINKIFKSKQKSFEHNNLFSFLNKLEEHNIYYQLNKIRSEAIMVEVVVPGQRWEVEFLGDGTIDVEKFISDKAYYDESEFDVLFKEFTD